MSRRRIKVEEGEVKRLSRGRLKMCFEEIWNGRRGKWEEKRGGRWGDDVKGALRGSSSGRKWGKEWEG